MRIIEFFGLPGAGKTFLARRMLENSNFKLVEIKTRKEKYFYVFLYFIMHPFAFWYFISKIIKENFHHKRLLRHKLTCLFFMVIAKKQKAFILKMLNKDKLVIDEGIAQFLLSLYERKIYYREIKRFKRFFPRDFLVKIVIADHSVRQRRISQRQRFPRRMIGVDFRKWEKIAEYNFNIIAEFVKNSFSCEIITNN